jgi:hypothetical protein
VAYIRDKKKKKKKKKWRVQIMKVPVKQFVSDPFACRDQ